jgi:DNA-binding response OmpR family regulator
MRILIIEDDLNLLNLYSKLLNSRGHTTDRVATLHAAQTMMLKRDYDVCISDLHLGFKSDASIAAQLSELQKTGTHVIVISGQDDMEDLCLSLGIQFYNKPIDNTELIQIVEKQSVI